MEAHNQSDRIVIKLHSDFTELSQQWDDVVQSSDTSNTPFLSFVWIQDWWKATEGRERSEPWIVCATLDGQIIGIAPLVRIRRYGCRVLHFLGTSFTGYSEIVTTDKTDHCRLAIFQWLLLHRHEWDVIILKELAISGEEAMNYCTTADSAGLRYHKGTEYSHVITHTRGTWNDYVSKRPGSFKAFLGNIRRHSRRLSELGELEISHHCSMNPQEYSFIQDEIENIEKRSWKYTAGSSWLCNAAQRDFYKRIMERFRENGLEIWVVRLSGKAICYCVNLAYANKLYYLIPSYDKEFAKYSVGTLLLKEMIEKCFSTKIDTFDFLPGNEPYEFRWGTVIKQSYQLTVWHSLPRSIMGYMIFVLIRRLRNWGKLHLKLGSIQNNIRRLIK